METHPNPAQAVCVHILAVAALPCDNHRRLVTGHGGPRIQTMAVAILQGRAPRQGPFGRLETVCVANFLRLLPKPGIAVRHRGNAERIIHGLTYVGRQVVDAGVFHLPQQQLGCAFKRRLLHFKPSAGAEAPYCALPLPTAGMHLMRLRLQARIPIRSAGLVECIRAHRVIAFTLGGVAAAVQGQLRADAAHLPVIIAEQTQAGAAQAAAPAQGLDAVSRFSSIAAMKTHPDRSTAAVFRQAQAVGKDLHAITAGRLFLGVQTPPQPFLGQ